MSQDEGRNVPRAVREARKANVGKLPPSGPGGTALAMLAALGTGGPAPSREIEPGYSCTNCGQSGEHAAECRPPRGLVVGVR